MAGLIGLFGIGDALFTPVHPDAITDRASDDRRGGGGSGMPTLRRLGTTRSPPAFALVLVLADFEWPFLLAGLTYLSYAIAVVIWLAPDG